MDRSFLDYFRCPAEIPAFEASGPPSGTEGYFRFEDVICYGRCTGASPSPRVHGSLPRVPAGEGSDADTGPLPFDLSEVVTNLQRERYRKGFHNRIERTTSTAATRAAYYLIRPLLPVHVRKHLQRARLSGWQSIPFPNWPVDRTVESLMRSAMRRALNRMDPVPFIWFWPDGAESCVVMTHDLEGQAGREFTPELMDLDESFGLKSAFQFVPQWLSGPSHSLIDRLRARGFEVNLHDLNHDGSLFRDRREFARRAALINEHARELGCRGFRSGAMYREQDWYDAFELSYDMSVPNVAHLEPQRGGCCTVTPYFVGNILELPLTTTQDYSLYHILNDYSTVLWKHQIDAIRAVNGLISFITHPDYLIETRARSVYVKLLEHLAWLRSEGNIWTALPGEVDRWWRARDQMRLMWRGGAWIIEGPRADRARVAYATLKNGRLVYKRDVPACQQTAGASK